LLTGKPKYKVVKVLVNRPLPLRELEEGRLILFGNPNIILPHDPRRRDSDPCFSCFQKPHEDERGAYKDLKLEQDACHYPFKKG